MIFVGWICGRASSAIVLICCYLITITSGFYMIHFTHEAGSNINFTIGFLITQIMDSCNFVASQTLLQERLLPDSRGVILSLNTIMFAVGSIVVFQMIEIIQDHYGKNLELGGRGVYMAVYIILSAYTSCLAIYLVFRRFIKCCKPKTS